MSGKNKFSSKVLMLRKEDFLISFIDLLLVFFAFKYFLFEYYSIDSYGALYASDQGAIFHLTNGRFILSLCIFVLNFFKINMVHNSAIFNIIYFFTIVFCINITVKKIEHLIIQNTNTKLGIFQKIFINAALFIGFCNIFSAEWLYFNMCTIQFILSILFATIAAIILFNNKKTGFLLSLLSLFISYNSYQIGLGVYVWLVLILVYLSSIGRFNKNCFITLIKAIIVCSTNFIINLVILKFLLKLNVISSAERYTIKGSLILQNVKLLLENQKIIWYNGNGMTPFPLLFISLILFIIFVIYSLIKQKKGALSCIYPFVLLLGGYTATFVSSLFGPYFWCAPRQIMPLFFGYTFLLIVLFYTNGLAKNTIKYFTICWEGVFILCTVFIIQIYTSDILQVNKLDKSRAYFIKDYISKYEFSTGNKINNIGFCSDMYPTWRYDLHMNYWWDVAETLFMPEWSNITGFNYYTNSGYTKIEVPEEIKNSFTQRDWKTLNLEEQIIFDEDKCYICNY